MIKSFTLSRLIATSFWSIIIFICVWTHLTYAAIVTVDAKADIFVAGGNATLVVPVPPATGLDGVLPTEIALPNQADRILTLTSVTGEVTCMPSTAPTINADGYGLVGDPCFFNPPGGTNISAVNSISGVQHSSSTLFLTGLLLGSSSPSLPPTDTFDLATIQHDENIYPQLNQVFFIGDGLTGTGSGISQKFHIPATATRLFLGFADAGGFQGQACCYSDNEGAFTVTYEINTAPVTNTLTLALTGTGNGSVSSHPQGTQCGVNCTQYPQGTPVSLTATPDSNSQFMGWKGAGCSDTFNITADMNCTAVFDLSPPTTPTLSPLASTMNVAVTIKGSGKGIIGSDPFGIRCGNALDEQCTHRSDFLFHCLCACCDACSQDFDTGTFVTLTPQADSNSVFSGWGGSCANTDGQLFMNHNFSCTAYFDLVHLLTVAQAGSGTGSISSYGSAYQPTGIRCGEGKYICTQRVKQSKKVVLKATPALGSQFTQWSEDCSGHDNPLVFKMESAKNCTANFTVSP